MITDNQDSQDLSKACVAARYLGTEHQLAADLGRSGYKISVEEISLRGEAFGEVWRVGDDTKQRCHLCCEMLPHAGALCSCIRKALPRRYVDINNAKILANLPEEKIALTHLCSSCGVSATVTVGEVRTAIAKHGSWKDRRMCGVCFDEQCAARRGKKETQAVQLQAQAAAALPPMPSA